MPIRWRRKSTKCSCKLQSYRYSCRAHPDSKIASRRFPRQWPLMLRKSRILNKWLAALQPVLPHWKRMQPPSPVDPARQDLGKNSDTVTAPQPLGLSGPMAQGHLMTIEIQDEDSTRSQAPKMNKHGVPFHYDSHVSNTTLELRIGSTIFGKSIQQHLSEFIAKQVPCRSGLFLKHEPNVKTLLLDIKMMVSPMQLTVHSAAPIQLSRERELADQLKVLFPDGDDEGAFIIPALDARSHVLSIKNRRNGVGKPVLKLASLGSGQTFTLVAPELSVPGISPKVLQRVLSLKPSRSMCDGRLFASSPFCRLACRGALVRSFPFRWVLHFVLSLTRGVVLHDSACCSREDSFDEYGRPCDTLSCLLFSALWLRCNQSETPSAKDTDMTCSKMLRIKATTCLQVGPMSLDWPVDPFVRSDFSRSSLHPEVPSGEQQLDAFPASTRSRWRQDALQAQPQILQRTKG